MHPSPTSPQRIPQRVVVAGAPGPELTAFRTRLAEALDVPLIEAVDLAGPAEIAALAAFDGWLTTADHPAALPVLLERADLVVHFVAEEPGTIRGLVRRTVRRLRESERTDLTWLENLGQTHPHLPVAHLAGATAANAWLDAGARSAAGADEG